ncbi:MAG: DUF2189 domain-containing protein [Burkholderiaceae bacterium]
MPGPVIDPAEFAVPVRQIALLQPLQWLVRGARDMARCGWVSVAHGVAVAAFGVLLLWLGRERFWLLAGAFSGFLVMAPVVATGLYVLSRALSRGAPANLSMLLHTWALWRHMRRADPAGYWCMVRFGLLLALAGTGWVLTSAAFITLFAPAPINNPADFLRHVVIAPGHYVFELWLALGGALAAPVFASSVVSMQLLLDRRVTALQAVLTSWRAVLANPLPMALWAALLLGLTLLGFATALLGLAVIIPILGHASWHAYEDLVDAAQLPPRVAAGAPA